MEHAEILHRCFRCGYCKLPGSLKFRFETYSPGGRMWLLRAWLDGEIETSQRLADILFSCTACGNCVEHCVFAEFKADLLNAFTAGREELVDQGTVPGTVARYLKLIQLYGNPYGLPEADRGRWADGLGIQPYSGQEYLFYVGCPGSYDERGRAMARAVARLLKEWDVDFGILGEQERCDGNEVRVLGESGLFERLAKENVEQWGAAGVKKILTLSPHAFHAIRNEYPRFGGVFEVYHYSQVLAGLLPGRKFRQANAEPLRVTFHDPCYLGRHNKDSDAEGRSRRASRSRAGGNGPSHGGCALLRRRWRKLLHGCPGRRSRQLLPGKGTRGRRDRSPGAGGCLPQVRQDVRGRDQGGEPGRRAPGDGPGRDRGRARRVRTRPPRKTTRTEE